VKEHPDLVGPRLAGVLAGILAGRTGKNIPATKNGKCNNLKSYPPLI
jgi:hypothetical protein